MDYLELMRTARKTNAGRDRSERKAGFATPTDGPISEHVRTAMMAIEAGIITTDWGGVAEGQAMLEEIYARLKGREL